MIKQQRDKVRYAVVGAGNIAQVAMLPAFQQATENSELVALISGDATKRAELAKKYAIPLSGDYAELENLLKAGNIDAVYIATPNALHREHAARAAAVGVHVLCEKPLAPSHRECEEIAKVCSDTNVKLMVAYRLHFEDGTISALDLVRQKTLGDVLSFDSVFGHRVRPDDIRMQPELGGGACLDLGVYCINMARHTFAAEPLAVSAAVTEKGGVDDSATAILRFEGDRVAQFTVSNSFASTSSFRIAGTAGNLRVEPAFDYANGLEHYLTIEKDTRHRSFEKRDQFAPQLVYFSRCVLNDEDPGPSGAEGIADVRVVEAILLSAKTGKVVTLEAREYTYGPSREQEQKAAS